MVQGNRLQSFILRRQGELCHPAVVYVINLLSAQEVCQADL
jgi:hypothetical protein